MEGLAVEVPVAALPAVTFAASSSSSSSSASSSPPPPFLCKTYDMVDDPATDLVVSWSTSSNSFVVWSVPELARDVLPKYFKHNNFSSFVRQLNTYGFRKVDPDRWEFANEGFLRGQKHLLNRINRRKPTAAHPNQQQATSCMQSTASKSCVEVGKFGLDEEVESLKRDKNLLMQELVRLKQHQQNTDKHLQNVGQRVQVMEQRQQQMMSFLAKAMHNPGFLSQLVQQQNESSQHIKGINKKRRLPKNDEDVFGGINGAALDGQIVKFQPLINEAAKSMLRQILKLDSSPGRDQPIGGPNAFLIDGFEPPSALDNGYSTAQDSGGTLAHIPTVSEQLSIPAEIALAHMPTVSEQLSIPAEIALPVEYSSVLTSDNLLSAQIAMNPNNNAVGSSEMNIHNAEQANILPVFDHVPEALQEGSVAFSNMTFASNETSNASVMGPLAAVADESVPIDADELSSHLELDVLLDGIPKLPGSNDAFWEQFFSSISSPEDADDNLNIIAEGGLSKDHGLKTDQPAPWDRVQHMSNLTEQMGLLSAKSKRV